MFIIIILFTVVVVLSVYMGFYIYWLNKRYAQLNNIPGPTSAELFRNILFASPEYIWTYFRKLAQTYPGINMYWHTVYPIVNITHHNDVEVFLSSTKHISKSQIYDTLQPWLGTGLLTSTGGKWQHRRKILTPAFHFNILREFIDVFNDHSKTLVKTLEIECTKPFTNIVPLITQSALNSICETAMGTKLAANQENAKEYTNATYRLGQIIIDILINPWFQFKWLFPFLPKYWEFHKLLKIVHNFSTTVIKKRKQQFQLFAKDTKKRMALLDILISAQNFKNDIDDDGIREEVDTFMFEGHDTTTSCICFSLLAIANNSNVQNKIVEELQRIFNNSERLATFEDLQNMTYLDKVLKECLRLYPSVPIISRVAEEDTTLKSGYVIPEGTILQFQIYDLHRNPEVFPDPEKFDPERFSPENSKNRHPFAYVPFSAGPRNCIGQKFAMLEVKTVISLILRNFHLFPIDTPADIKIGVHLILKSVKAIKIKFGKRTNTF